MFFGFFLFINSSPRLTLYRHIVAVKATIDKQSPHAKLLCPTYPKRKKFRRFEAGRSYQVTAEIPSATPRRMINNFCDPKTND